MAITSINPSLFEDRIRFWRAVEQHGVHKTDSKKTFSGSIGQVTSRKSSLQARNRNLYSEIARFRSVQKLRETTTTVRTLTDVLQTDHVYSERQGKVIVLRIPTAQPVSTCSICLENELTQNCIYLCQDKCSSYCSKCAHRFVSESVNESKGFFRQLCCPGPCHQIISFDKIHSIDAATATQFLANIKSSLSLQCVSCHSRGSLFHEYPSTAPAQLSAVLSRFGQENANALENMFVGYTNYQVDVFQLVNCMRDLMLSSRDKIRASIQEQLEPMERVLRCALYMHTARPSMEMRTFMLSQSFKLGRDYISAGPTFLDSTKQEAQKVIAQNQLPQFCSAVLDLQRQLTNPRDSTAFIKPFINAISDPERRATLQLRFNLVFPEVISQCCGARHCFKCKTGHHEGPCESRSLNNSIKQCDRCGISIVKGDGCNSITCVCGHNFTWS